MAVRTTTGRKVTIITMCNRTTHQDRAPNVIRPGPLKGVIRAARRCKEIPTEVLPRRSHRVFHPAAVEITIITADITADARHLPVAGGDHPQAVVECPVG